MAVGGSRVGVDADLDVALPVFLFRCYSVLAISLGWCQDHWCSSKEHVLMSHRQELGGTWWGLHWAFAFSLFPLLGYIFFLKTP